MHAADLERMHHEVMLIQPVVLSGGSGTRLWPLSREKYPKQLLSLVGNDSLLQATVRRTESIPGMTLAPPMVVCNEEYRFVIAEQLRLMDKPGPIVLEPAGRNTAPALTLAALAAVRDGADPLLLVMPADHVITDTAAFRAVVASGAVLAAQGMVVTFGITADTPETGYGYIQAGADLATTNVTSASDGVGAARRISRFVEKPNLETARSYLADGSYLWNSGLFMMKASVWLSAITLCRSDIHAACARAWKAGRRDGDFLRVDRDIFAACPSDSIDYAVMERLAAGPARGSANSGMLPVGVVIPLRAGWSDVGA